jgi:histidinol-phosphatase (PHP family)
MLPSLLYDTHMHTPLCRHARGEPEAYAAAAAARNLKGIVFTCHNPLPGGYSQGARMYMEQFDEYLALVARAQSSADVEVHLGLECDVVAGMTDFLQAQIASAPFEYILGSVHPNIREFRDAYWQQGALAVQRIYFEQLAWVAETGLVDCLSHPDVVKHDFPAEWDLERIMPDVCRALDRIARTGCAMELNTSGLYKQCAQMSPAPAILAEMRSRRIPVVIGSDAHSPERVGDAFDRALDALAAAGYTHTSVFLERRRLEIPITDARSSLA